MMLQECNPLLLYFNSIMNLWTLPGNVCVMGEGDGRGGEEGERERERERGKIARKTGEKSLR